MLLIISAAIAVLSLRVQGEPETWHLQAGEDWKALSSQGSDRYLAAVSEIKQLALEGQSAELTKAILKLKTDFPNIAGPDLDEFVAVETLCAKGKFSKAAISFEKFMDKYPDSRWYEVALDREYAIGMAYLNGQKKTVLGILRLSGYDEGEKIMDKILDRAGDAPIAVKATLACAQSLEKRGKYEEAYLKWSQINSLWPTGQLGKESVLAMGRCKHAAYKGPKYDCANLVSAKTYYEKFKFMDPQEASKLEIDEKINQINEQLAYKQYSIGHYYQKTGNMQSASLYYQMVNTNSPQTRGAQMAGQEMDKITAGVEKKENDRTKAEQKS